MEFLETGGALSPACYLHRLCYIQHVTDAMQVATNPVLISNNY